MRKRIVTLLVAAITAVGIALAVMAPANAAPLPVTWNFPTGFLPNIDTVENPPPGALEVEWRDDTPAPACRSDAHPEPVLLLHGTWENQSNNWQAMAPFLKNKGYCVYTMNYGGDEHDPFQGVGPIAESARQIGVVVDKILASTGQPKLAIVGHSQGGGVTPRWYLKFLGGGAKVDKLIGVSPSNHGTTLSGLANLLEVFPIGLVFNLTMPAAVEQTIGSPVNVTLDADGDTVPGVAYTVIINKDDQVVTPYTNAFLTAGPGASVTNIELSQVCPLNHSEHLSTPYDSYVGDLVVNALSPESATPPACRVALPLIGG